MGRYVLIKAGAVGIQLPDGSVRDAKAAVAIVSSTNASPIAVTSAAHGLTTGDRVFIAGHVTNTAANGLWKATVVDATHFTLDNSTGNGVGGATGTIRKDAILLTDDQFSALGAGAIDGDPLIDLGESPSIDGDQVTIQGAAATTTATAPAALTVSAIAAVTTTAIATADGSDPTTTQALANATKAKFNTLLTEFGTLITEVTALRADVAAIRARQGTIITELAGLDAAVSGSGKAVAP
jgi:hypothetical protein